MSIERRLRQGLQLNGSVLDPEIEPRLAGVRRRTRRRVAVQRVTATAAVVAGLVALATFGPDLVRAIRTPTPPEQPADRPTLPPASAQALTGTFETTLDADTELIDANAMGGRWTIQLLESGAMVVGAPDAYAGVVTGVLFEATDDRFRTNLFEQDLCAGTGVGVYRWTLAGRSLSFTPVNDSCTARVALFAGGSWQAEA